ncbi:hypothetical protein ACFVY1_47425 [Streptomyces sp. NPDC058293]|uniref:SbtR family transcriptional regulator n=1 Tax=Streptomyces sp. NPDC058293 TaxID=3346429 RepID=UPI0036E3D15F
MPDFWPLRRFGPDASCPWGTERGARADVVRADVKALVVGCLAREQQGPDPQARERMVDLACVGLRAQR